jgi:hypothetical protein
MLIWANQCNKLDFPKFTSVGGVFRRGESQMGQARIKKLKLQRELAEKNPNASPEELAKLVAEARVSAAPSAVKVLMSDVGPIDAAQLRINAIHEAGHAVIMTRIAYGCEVTTVDPQEVKRLTGHAMPGFTRPVHKQIKARVYMCTALAGITSEAMYATNGLVSATEDDIAHANEILDSMGLQGEPRERQLLASRVQTQQLVAQYKAEIISVSDALTARLTLTGEEVRALIGNSHPPESE